MEEIPNWLINIYFIALFGFYSWSEVIDIKYEGRREGNIRHLYYSKSYKISFLLFIPIGIFILYLISQLFKGYPLVVLSLFTFGIILIVFFTYQTFFVKFAYDDEFVYYKSLLAGYKRESWKNLVNIGYTKIVEVDYIVIKGIGKIWLSDKLNGYEELDKFLDYKAREVGLRL
ncbi:MAG: hypothetical protein JXQ76_10455 [Campylobacterales bacterium]|nr:hypothetical protein [Campylobacterales bacterium]